MEMFRIVLALLLILSATNARKKPKPKSCINPTGKVKETYSEGCYEFTCTKKRKKFLWKKKFVDSKCCIYKSETFYIDQLIQSTPLGECDVQELRCKAGENSGEKAEVKRLIRNARCCYIDDKKIFIGSSIAKPKQCSFLDCKEADNGAQIFFRSFHLGTDCCMMDEHMHPPNSKVQENHCCFGRWQKEECQEPISMMQTDTTDINTSNMTSCNDPSVKSCLPVIVNENDLFSTKPMRLPNGILLMDGKTLQSNRKGGQSMTHVYKTSENLEALFTEKRGVMYGSIPSTNGIIYALENCGTGCHLWIERDTQEWTEETEEDNRGLHSGRPLDPNLTTKTTIVDVHVTVYYTAAFAASTPNLDVYMDLLFSETNHGYTESGVPIRVVLHCLIETTIADGLSPYQTRQELTNLESSYEDIRKSADIAILLVNSFSFSGACGIAYLHQLYSGFKTFGVAKKSCAVGYYSFGHEIAHLYGLYHNRETGHINPVQAYGHGYIIKPGEYRSILAYNFNGETRINRYSNPDVTYDEYITGNSETANNARLLREGRVAMSNIGNEEMQCPGSCPQITCSLNQMEVPSSFNIPCNQPICVDKNKVLVLMSSSGALQAYGKNGICGSISDLPESRVKGGLAFVSGKLVAYGGWFASYGRRNSWQYNPLTDQWEPLPDMKSAVYNGGYSAGLLPDGTEVAHYFGGASCSGGSCSNRVHTYNPFQSVPWTVSSSLPNDISESQYPCAVSVGHTVIVISQNGEYMYKYQPLNEEWTQLVMNLPLTSVVSCALMDRPIGVGIIVFSNNGDAFFSPLKSILTSSVSWMQMPSLPVNYYYRSPLGMVMDEFIFVSSHSQFSSHSLAYKWNEDSSTWQEIHPSTVPPRNGAYTLMPEDYVLGCDSSCPACDPTDMVIPAKYNYLGSSCDTCISTDNVMISTGGLQENTVKAYGPSGMCGTIADLPALRSNPGMAFIENHRLIVYGGWFASYGRRDVWEYDKSSSSWKTLNNMPDGAYGGSYGSAQISSSQWNAFYFGGAPCGGGWCNPRVSIYNGNSNQWSTASNYPRDARSGCTVTIGRFILIIADNSRADTKVELYDSATGNFESLSKLQHQVSSPVCSLVKLGYETGIMVFGKDYAGNMNLQYLKMSNILSGPWVVLDTSRIGCDLLSEAWKHGASIKIGMIGGKITIFGGTETIKLVPSANPLATNIGTWQVAPANTFDTTRLSSFTQVPRDWFNDCLW